MDPRSLRATTALFVALLGCGETEPGGSDPPHDGPCGAGEVMLDVGGCRPAGPPAEVVAGVPPEACGAGFEADGAWGCLALVPDTICAQGTMAVPGDARCREVGACGAAPWGDVVPDASAEFVDGAYVGADSDGSEAKPWTTIQDGVAAAAEGAMVVVAAGTYAGPVEISGKRVRLHGRCASMVTVTAGGSPTLAMAVQEADGSEVHGLAMTGPGFGVGLSGVTDVLFDEVWIHDTSAAGMQGEDTLGETSFALRGSLVDGATGTGIVLLGAEVTIERSAIRSTRLHGGSNVAEGEALRVRSSPARGARARAEVRGSLIEDSRDSAIFVLGSDLVLEDTLVRDSRPIAPGKPGGFSLRVDDASPEPPANIQVRRSILERSVGFGILAAGGDVAVDDSVIRDVGLDSASPIGVCVGMTYGGGGAQPGTLAVRRSLVERCTDTGIYLRGAVGTLDQTRVRDVFAGPLPDQYGVGVLAQGDASAGVRSTLSASSCVVEGTRGVALEVFAADADVEGSALRDVQQASDGHFGLGVAAAGQPGPIGASAVTLGSCVVERCLGSGIYILDAMLEMTDTLVRDVQPQVQGGDFGDGLTVAADVATAEAHLHGVRIEASARAGIASFGARVELDGTRLECNAIHLDGEPQPAGPFSFADLGGNECGCGTKREDCRVLSASLAPPEPIPAPQ